MRPASAAGLPHRRVRAVRGGRVGFVGPGMRTAERLVHPGDGTAESERRRRRKRRERGGGDRDGPEAAAAAAAAAVLKVSEEHKCTTGRCVSAELKQRQRMCIDCAAPAE